MAQQSTCFDKTQPVVEDVGNETGIAFPFYVCSPTSHSRYAAVAKHGATGLPSAYAFLSCLIAFCLGLKLTKHNDLLDNFGKTPRLATAVLWAASRDEAMVVEHLVGIGRRDAKERTAHFLLELGARLKLVGLGSTSGYACPLSQYLLADVLGLSAVHVNCVLRELREDGLVTFQHGRVEIHDLVADKGSFAATRNERLTAESVAVSRTISGCSGSGLLQVGARGICFRVLPVVAK